MGQEREPQRPLPREQWVHLDKRHKNEQVFSSGQLHDSLPGKDLRLDRQQTQDMPAHGLIVSLLR